MISVEEAKHRISAVVAAGETTSLPLDEAAGHVIAVDVRASMPLPSFRQSAMDGYAVNLLPERSGYTLVGEVAAGQSSDVALKPGEAMRIFTGAAVPEGANAVIIQEWTEASIGRVELSTSAGELVENMNIRPVGEQIASGDIVIERGNLLNAAALGMLQSFGIEEVKVYRKPSFALVVTGNEIVPPGNPLPKGSIYESNSITLGIALREHGFNLIWVERTPDDLESTQVAIERASEKADIVLISGGISVGDYDFVHPALMNMGVEEVFYKVAQKPGKPLFFGQREHQLFFGLPGNPASALVCLYEYAIPAAFKIAGSNSLHPKKIYAPLLGSYALKGDRAQFLKAKLHDHGVEILPRQASSMIHSFITSDCLVYLKVEKSEYIEGDLVEVHLI